jgi:hypothetical protein
MARTTEKLTPARRRGVMLYRVCAVIAAVALWYGFAAFVSMEPNPANWPLDGRALFAVLGVWIAAEAAMLPFPEK